jgi:hypothetical protein
MSERFSLSFHFWGFIASTGQASWQFVQSSNINALAYDEEENSLYVNFHSGGVYEYLNVPYWVFKDFLSAPSKEKFFFWRIKDKFQWVRHS